MKLIVIPQNINYVMMKLLQSINNTARTSCENNTVHWKFLLHWKICIVAYTSIWLLCDN